MSIPDSKTGKPKDHNYTATAANEFLTKVSETRLGEMVPGETKNLSYSLCPTPSLSPVKKIADDCSLLVTEKPKEKKEKLLRVFF